MNNKITEQINEAMIDKNENSKLNNILLNQKDEIILLNNEILYLREFNINK